MVFTDGDLVHILFAHFVYKLYIYYIQNYIMEPERTSIIEAIAVVDIDPSLAVYCPEQQKWLTSLEFLSQPQREKNNSKIIALAPHLYLSLTFCENNKDPIYQIEFLSKATFEWTPVKNSELSLNILGMSLCYKTDPDQLSGPLCDIDLLAIERKNRYGEHKDVINVPHGYKIVSHQLPLGYLVYRKVKGVIQQTFKAHLTEKIFIKEKSRVNLSQLPLFCFPDGIKLVRQIRGFATFNFIFTLQNAERVFITCLVFKQNFSKAKRQKIGIFTSDNLFYEKALCIVANYNYTDQIAQSLQHLYRLSLSKSEIPFYRIIESFVTGLKYPVQQKVGKMSLSYCYNGNKIIFPTSNSYPIVSERALYSVFKFLTIDNIINVFQALLLEKKVFFISHSKTILGFSVEAFTNLLFPFKWEQVLIPILPSNLRDYLTAPVPLVAGISPSLVDESIQDDSILVFLDKNQVLNDEDLPPLPQKLYKQLKKRLQKFQVYDYEQVNEYLQNPESTYLFKMQEVQDPHFQGHIIRDIFFQFNLTLMKNYRKYLTKTNKTHEESSMQISGIPSVFQDIFRLQDFLSDLGMTKIGSFGFKFAQSSIFTSFIEKKCHHPKDPQIVFFDECIQRKKSKKDVLFIQPIINTEEQIIQNPKLDPQNCGPFFYDRFPSLLKQVELKQEQIDIKVQEQQVKQNTILQIIEQQYLLKFGFFDPPQHSQLDQLLYKMIHLLLKKNRNKFCHQKIDQGSSEQIFNQFFGIYSKQCVQIEDAFNEWPMIQSPEVNKLRTISKAQYLKLKINSPKQLEPLKNQVIGIAEGKNYQILINQHTRVIITNSGQSLTKLAAHKVPEGIVIQIKSPLLMQFFSSVIIQKQVNILMDYLEKQTAKDLRASCFKRIAYKPWTIQNFLQFKDWIQVQKEFGTGNTTV